MLPASGSSWEWPKASFPLGKGAAKSKNGTRPAVVRMNAMRLAETIPTTDIEHERLVDPGRLRAFVKGEVRSRDMGKVARLHGVAPPF